ncbi:DUF817 domain-containing protein [Heyndrickxia sp. NPDC080065]|uniref:DUF817 domain-containing protein n=1 Tax=Heyndrickxia sp. NPDC080065 TaxID=3390568 RepID=UPI003D0491ED
MKLIRHLMIFGYHQALSCIFPLVIFITLACSKFVTVSFLYRYDLILLVCLLTQLVLLLTKIETIDEFKVICLFHLLGLLLEIYKIHMGSWAYPEHAWTKVFGVPLYSGFMYASVASYMCQAWRRLNLQLKNWPSIKLVWILSLAIYLNFFTHHFILDIRWLLVIVILVLFFKTTVSFSLKNTTYKMPLVLSFLLIGFFVWIAENISTYFGAWQYPNQQHGWELVGLGKISSWVLLVIVSFIAVAQLKFVKEQKNQMSGSIEA